MTIRTSVIYLGAALTALSVVSSASFAAPARNSALAESPAASAAVRLAQYSPGGTVPSGPSVNPAPSPSPGYQAPRAVPNIQVPRSVTPRTFNPSPGGQRFSTQPFRAPRQTPRGPHFRHYRGPGYPNYGIPIIPYVPYDDYYEVPDQCSYWHDRCARAFGYPTRRYQSCMVRHSCEPL